MSYKEYSGALAAAGLKVGIVISRFNDFLTRQLLAGALDGLKRHGADEADITVVWVPGAYELPLAVQKLARGKSVHAVIALGAVIQGATPHAGLINAHVARTLAQIALETGRSVEEMSSGRVVPHPSASTDRASNIPSAKSSLVVAALA